MNDDDAFENLRKKGFIDESGKSKQDYKNMNQDFEDDKFEKMGRDNIAQLVPTKSDADLAEEYKQKLIEAHEPLLKILTELDKAGFASQVQCGKNALGKFQIMQLQIIKIY